MCKSFNLKDPNFSANGSYTSTMAYAQSKLGQILFCNKLRKKLEANSCNNIDILVLHPGNVTTEVVRTLPRVVQTLYNWIMPFFLLTPEEGARSSIYAATTSSAVEDARDTFGYYNSNCEPTYPSKSSRDENQAEDVWSWTIEQLRTYMTEQSLAIIK